MHSASSFSFFLVGNQTKSMEKRRKTGVVRFPLGHWQRGNRHTRKACDVYIQCTQKLIISSSHSKTVSSGGGKDNFLAMHKLNTNLICLCIVLIFSHVECRPRNQLPISTVKTDRPIIGILAQNTGSFMNKTFGPTYIVASYVKYIESAGGRVVPIRNDLSEDQLEKLFSSINGVLLPGGGADLSDSPYARTGKILFNLAVKANKAGDVFPLWGTCLGFEFLSICGSGGAQVTSLVDGENYSVPLNLSEGYQSSRLFGSSAPEEIITYLKTKDVTFNHHQACVSTDEYHSNKALNKFFRLLSTNRDKEGKKEFVSTIEAYDYPFYGTQWHPEKNSFEWTSREAINHSKEAVLVTQYMANFFVNQARLSGHHFPNKQEEDDALIYKYSPVYCYPEITDYEQCYVFQKSAR